MTFSTPPIRLFGILPAAGMSRRMGVPKQSLSYGKNTMTAHVAGTMLAANLNAVVVVTRTELVEAIELPQDDRLLVAINDDSSSQMLDSIRLGLDHLDDAFSPSKDAGILIIPADMPTVSTDACQRCIEVFRKKPSSIVVATCHGKRGHPIMFPFSLRQSLDDLAGGLNGLPRMHADLLREVAIDDPNILRDVDTRSDYDKLKQ